MEIEVVGDVGSDEALACETTRYGIAMACKLCCSAAVSVAYPWAGLRGS